MFESWLGEIITRFVGHFLDVKKEQLRVSLWSGELRTYDDLYSSEGKLNKSHIQTLHCQLLLYVFTRLTLDALGCPTRLEHRPGAGERPPEGGSVRVLAASIQHQGGLHWSPGSAGLFGPTSHVPHGYTLLTHAYLSPHDCAILFEKACAAMLSGIEGRTRTIWAPGQVPWRALQSRPVVVELSDVWLCACPRTEEEWEEDLAGQRAKVCLHSRPYAQGCTYDNVHASVLKTETLPHLRACITCQGLKYV